MSGGVSYAAPGDMTIVAWHAWALVTDDEGISRVVRYSSDEGARWSDVPDDGMLGVKLFHAARIPDGSHCAMIFEGADWYFKAQSSLGDVWGHTTNRAEDLPDGRYRNVEVKHGMWAPMNVWGPTHEEMSRDKR